MAGGWQPETDYSVTAGIIALGSPLGGEDGEVILIEELVPCHQGQAFSPCFGHKDAVERIGVDRRKRPDRPRVLGTHRQFNQAGLSDSLQESLINHPLLAPCPDPSTARLHALVPSVSPVGEDQDED